MLIGNPETFYQFSCQWNIALKLPTWSGDGICPYFLRNFYGLFCRTFRWGGISLYTTFQTNYVALLNTTHKAAVVVHWNSSWTQDTSASFGRGCMWRHLGELC